MVLSIVTILEAFSGNRAICKLHVKRNMLAGFDVMAEIWSRVM